MTAANSNGKNALGALKLQATTADTVAKDIANIRQLQARIRILTLLIQLRAIMMQQLNSIIQQLRS